jgi:hypothetical protein
MNKKISRRQVLKEGAGTMLTAVLPQFVKPKEINTPEPEEKRHQWSEAISYHAITHGGIQLVPDPDLGVAVYGQTSIRYLRFGKLVELDYLELERILYGRWVPSVPTHPAHLIISILDRVTLTWKTIIEIDLPADPEISGKGLSEQMKIEEMEDHFARILKKPALRIELSGFQTDHLRVICDREHPVWPNHGECDGGIYNVPYGILNNLGAFGKSVGKSLFDMSYNPILKRKTIHPAAPKGMKIHDLPEMLLFQSKYLSVGLSLRRPLLMHLGWDILGSEQLTPNRLYASRRRSTGMNGICGTGGPLLRTLYGDYPSHRWTGEVTVEGNRIIYQNLQAISGLTIDAIFTVEEDRLTVEFTQHCKEDLPVIEAEVWRLAWDLKQGITGIAGMPTQQPGRNGDVVLPAIMASDGNGCISWNITDGNLDEIRLHIESYRVDNCISCGIVLGKHADPEQCQVIPSGTRKAAFELAVATIKPNNGPGIAEPSDGLKRHWSTIFSCFRPEYRGFSNNSASVNCHLSQGPPIEIAVHTQIHPKGPNPIDLARFTIEKGILNGGGYGYHRNLYLDSDPVLLSAAGKIHQADPNIKWLKRIEPGLVNTVNRMLNLMADEGLLVSRDLTGNSGSYRWSTNAMDVIGFGHIDGYVNAWAYRAFRNAAAMLDDLSHDQPLAQQCRQAAKSIRENYTSALLNPQTGWIAGWRSSDGELHDYGFTWVNGVALAFGLVDHQLAQSALLKLEQKREEVGADDARIGLPCNLFPIHEQDHILARILNQIQPTFETYTDGSFSAWPVTYYLRALSINGLYDRSKRLAQELSIGYEAGIFTGGNGSGNEFRSWEGLPTGYEGTLIGSLGPLYSIAIEEGIFEPSKPEWWPANG